METLTEKHADLLESEKFDALASTDAAALALVLENTAKEFDKSLNENTLSGDVSQFTPILMPMVRRVYPNLVANEILGVQPMSMPTGFIYALTNEYAGSTTNSISPLGSDIGMGGQILVSSIDVPAGETVTGATSAAVGTVVYSEADGVNFKLLVKITIGAPLSVEGFTTNAATPATGTISAFYTNEAAFGQILSNYTGTYTTAQAEALGNDMNEIGFSISKKSVEAQSRALKGKYSVEMYQDLKAQHGLLADEEIMSLMSYEMQAEIDRDIVNFVNTNSTQVANASNISFSGVSDAAGRWEIEKYRTEVIKISKESQQIGIDTKRGQGNVLIVSPKLVTMFEQVGSFKTATQKSGVVAPISGGIAGTFDSKFKVVVDQYATSDYATVLYKGADRRDTMGVFAPYVGLSFTKTTEFASAQPAIIAKTRYALTTIPGISSANSNDRAAKYSRSFGINFANSSLA